MQRIERTIRELIDFSRPASTAGQPGPGRARSSTKPSGIAKYYQRTKQRSITTDVPADLPAVVGVRDYLTQVVLNLVLNAVDATADQGRIHVAAREEDGFLVLSVEDDGRGISVADRCRLFQPYFTTKAHGTGLGLFVSRQILEDFAGTLTFDSEPGQGSTFVVRLPIERRDREPRPREKVDRPEFVMADFEARQASDRWGYSTTMPATKPPRSPPSPPLRAAAS